jgi:DNA repair exonuclease SbcCD ATPase subunit
MIKNLSIKNLKGLTGEYKFLPGVNTITGTCASGKTTIIEAMIIATNGKLVGRCPTAESKVRPWMRKLGLPMTVELTSDGPTSRYHQAADQEPEFSSEALPINPGQALQFLAMTKPARIRAVLEATDLTPWAAEWKAIMDERPSTVTAPTDQMLYDQVQTATQNANASASTFRARAGANAGFPPEEKKPDPESMAIKMRELKELETLAIQRQTRVDVHAEAKRRFVQTDEPQVQALKAAAVEEAAQIQRSLAAIEERLQATNTENRLIPRDEQPPQAGATCRTCGSDELYWSITPESVAAENDQRQAERKSLRLRMETLLGDKKPLMASLAQVQVLIEAKNKELMQAGCQAPEPLDFDPETLQDLAHEVQEMREATAADQALLKSWEAFEWSAKELEGSKAALEEITAWAKQVKAFNVGTCANIFSNVLHHGNRIANALNLEFLWSAGEIVTQVKGETRGYDMLSGAEQKLCCLAITLGLQLAAGQKLVIIDEAGVFDLGLRKSLKIILDEMVADGTIDQAIIVCPTQGELQLN